MKKLGIIAIILYNTKNVFERDEYLKNLKKRAKESHVYRKYQLIGLELAQILDDQKHKALYIKLAKEKNSEELLNLAKNIAERKGITNKGAYFMTLLSIQAPTWKKHTTSSSPVTKKKRKS
jgi:hypothetical protein